MQQNNLYIAETGKSVKQFVEDFAKIVNENQFVIHNGDKMDMKKTFQDHDQSVPEEFDLHMIQVCKPPKASKSLVTNVERAPLIPKFVHVFSQDDKTQVRFLSYSKEEVAALVPGDEKFPESIEQTTLKIRSMIDHACL